MIKNLLNVPTPTVPVPTSTSTSINVGQILRVIGFWGIFSNFGESGWKAIIPIYREWIWSKIVGREDVGKKYVITSILLIVVSLVILGAAVFGLAGATFEEVTLPSGETVSQITSFPIPVAIAIAIGALLLLILAIYTVVLHFRLGEAHVQLEHAASWLKWIWLFMPGVAAIYFGFIHHKYYFEAFWDKDYTPTDEPEEF